MDVPVQEGEHQGWRSALRRHVEERAIENEESILDYVMPHAAFREAGLYRKWAMTHFHSQKEEKRDE
jgi:hypothetical protein